MRFARVFNPHNRLSINPTHKPPRQQPNDNRPQRCPNHVRITCGLASSKLPGGWCHHFHHAPLVFTHNSTLSMHHKLSIQQQHCLCQTHSLRTEAEHTVFPAPFLPGHHQPGGCIITQGHTRTTSTLHLSAMLPLPSATVICAYVPPALPLARRPGLMTTTRGSALAPAQATARHTV